MPLQSLLDLKLHKLGEVDILRPFLDLPIKARSFRDVSRVVLMDFQRCASVYDLK